DWVELRRLGEEEAAAEFLVVRPFADDLEMDKAGLDLDDPDLPPGAYAEHVGAAPAGQRHFREAGVIVLAAEQPHYPALHAQGGRGLTVVDDRRELGHADSRKRMRRRDTARIAAALQPLPPPSRRRAGWASTPALPQRSCSEAPAECRLRKTSECRDARRRNRAAADRAGRRRRRSGRAPRRWSPPAGRCAVPPPTWPAERWRWSRRP